MKKIIAIVLSLVLLLSLAACNTDKDDQNAVKKEITRGTISGNVYQSTYSGLKFTKPDSWVYATDEEIASALNLGAEFMGDKFAEAVKNNPSVYDMMATDPMTGSNINIGYENLAKSFASQMTEAQYLDALKKQLSSVSSISVTFSEETKTVKLGGSDYLRAISTTTANGVTMQQIYYLRNIDGYMNFVIVTFVTGYELADIEAMFN